MNTPWPGDRASSVFERIVLSVVQLMLMLLVVVAIADLCYLLWHAAVHQWLRMQSIPALQTHIQHGFAGVLLVLIGLELVDTVRAYRHGHGVRVEVVLIVALIALGRHIIQIDLDNESGFELVGIAALVVALVAGYAIARNLNVNERAKRAAKRAQTPPSPTQADPP